MTPHSLGVHKVLSLLTPAVRPLVNWNAERRLAAAVNVSDVRDAAKARAHKMVFDYLDAGADDEITLRRNKDAFSHIELHYRVLAGLSPPLDLSTRILGNDVDVPFFPSPTAGSKMFHRDGEAGVARAAASHGAMYCLSTMGTTSPRDVAKALEHTQHTRGSGGKLFQLYVWKDRSLVRDLLAQAKAHGFRALALTVDLTWYGNRERDTRNGFTVPPAYSLRQTLDALRRPAWTWDFLSNPEYAYAALDVAAEARARRAAESSTREPHESVLPTDRRTQVAFIRDAFDPSFSWDDAEWLVQEWGDTGPVALKGVVRPDDALRAVERGFDAVWVSNHGGRQMETAPATVDVLPSVREALGGSARGPTRAEPPTRRGAPAATTPPSRGPRRRRRRARRRLAKPAFPSRCSSTGACREARISSRRWRWARTASGWGSRTSTACARAAKPACDVCSTSCATKPSARWGCSARGPSPKRGRRTSPEISKPRGSSGGGPRARATSRTGARRRAGMGGGSGSLVRGGKTTGAQRRTVVHLLLRNADDDERAFLTLDGCFHRIFQSSRLRYTTLVRSRSARGAGRVSSVPDRRTGLDTHRPWSRCLSRAPRRLPARHRARGVGGADRPGARRSVRARAASTGWPRDVAGAPSWKGVKFDEFTFEVKKCADGASAEKLVRAFCASDGLTADFCQSAVDLVVLAHNQKRPNAEIAMLQDLATALLREYRRRISEPEHFVADELMRRFASSDAAAAAEGNRESAARLAGCRAELRRVFLEGGKPRVNPTGAGMFVSGIYDEDDDDPSLDDAFAAAPPISRSKFLTHLERLKNRAADDAKWQRSVAATAIDADEVAVQEYVDPMDELEISRESLLETAKRAEMVQEMFREEIMR